MIKLHMDQGWAYLQDESDGSVVARGEVQVGIINITAGTVTSALLFVGRVEPGPPDPPAPGPPNPPEPPLHRPVA